jgi:Fe-S cluster assembly ATP-binding protein
MLIISSLKAGTDSRTILNGIDLSITERGEIHVLIGPNGSGKSTLSSVIMGMPGYRATGGAITFEGVDLLGLKTWQIARLGIFVAPQQSTAIPGVMLQDALEAATDGLTDGVPDLATQIDEEASKLKFDTAMLHRSLNTDLSGGEQKRSEIIQLAILKPKLAILDEIDSGLDVDGLRAITRRIREVVEEHGASILLVTHRTRILDELPVDKVHVMLNGRIVESGNIDLAEEIGSRGFAKYQATATG